MEGLRGGHQRRAEQGVRAVSDQEFCRAVLDQIPRATAAEREDICRELMEHLEDHREALMEGGLDEAAAQARSVEAMGDAGEIGRQWNQRLSPLWLWVGGLCKGAAIVLLVVLLIRPGSILACAADNLQARWREDPVESAIHPDAVWTREVDLRVQLHDQVIRIHRVALVEDDWIDMPAGRQGAYQLYVQALSYAQNPLRPALSRWGMRCNGEDGKQVGASPSPYNLRGADARTMAFPLEAGISTAVITFAPYGRTAATLSLPISWEEVSHAS